MSGKYARDGTYSQLQSRLSVLDGYVQFKPRFFNFWQVACISRTTNPHPPTVSALRRLWQKRDYFMLKMCFGNRI